MESIKSLRATLGLTQAALAEYLGIPRGVLAMCELGKRLLNKEAVFKLSDLENGYQNVKGKIMPVPVKKLTEDPSRLKLKAQRNMIRIINLNRQLERMQMIYEQNRKLCEVLQMINFTASDAITKDNNYRLLSAEYKRERNSEYNQEEIINKIKTLSAENDMIRGRLGDVEDPDL